MKNLFSLDSRFFAFMSKVADVIILNLLFLVFSIPVVTIGASVTALFTVSLKLSEGKEPYIAKEFFHSWKENFRQSTILWIAIMVIGLLFWLNFNLTASVSPVIYVIMLITLIITGMMLLYLFPLLAKFNNTLKNTVVNSFLMSLRHFLTTCTMFGTNVFFIFITIAFPSAMAQISMFWFLFGFALIARIQSYFLNKVFSYHIPEEETFSENETYMEASANDAPFEISENTENE